MLFVYDFRFSGIPKYNSASQMFANHKIPYFGELNRKYTFSFIKIESLALIICIIFICVTQLCKFILRYGSGGMY